MAQQNRRDFLKTSVAVAGASFAIGGTKSSGAILGANDRIRVAVAGLNGRGKSHMDAFSSMKNVQVTHVIDPDASQYDGAIKRVNGRGGNSPVGVKDARTVINSDEIDVLTIATPNHWHSLLGIWATAAGKDVYIEKPCSHNIHEGRILVETARKQKRIVQHGTQNRSSRHWAKIVAAIQSGKLGQLKVARGLCYKPRGSIGFHKPTTPPDHLDFNLWLGPAAEQPYHRNLVHYNWHWFWDTGNGDIGNQGVHQMDIARWGIPGATLPTSVISLGGRFGYKDQGETANTQMAILDYGETQLVFEVRGLPTPRQVTNYFHFEDGTIKPDGKFYPKGKDQGESLPDVEFKVGDGGHFGNFINAVRSRNVSELNADVLEGHYSSAAGHLANISQQLGIQESFDDAGRSLVGNRAATATLDRMKAHLNDAGVNVSKAECTVGPELKFDPKTERFVDNEAANALLTRPGRGEFTVPTKPL